MSDVKTIPITETENIMEYQGITVSRSIFKQMREVRQEEYAKWTQEQERDHWNVANWRGYVIETFASSVGEIQTIHFIFEMHGSLARIRESDLFWLLREQKWLKVPGDAVKELAKMLPQIWVK